MKEQTRLIRSQAEKSAFREHAVPLYLTSSFTFEDAQHGTAIFADEIDANVYSRFSNPNTSEFVRKVC
ncbi:PLP-dependent transferase [Dyadobacter sp. LHD-138]|uniref:PLP-dependent transferase n=1 Tax=Dyadobacter sp. LHD-138 TaxID=3071413 RepID=UPI0027DF8254|nr:PLP-dependent transferase [Dyadobacter sp. LHD-138]MDQ6480550.1 PLP-dependent transferase [Dyadobacter sp. LHD-138]